VRATVTHVGAATIAITVGGLNMLTDPALDPAGTTFEIPVPALGRSLRMRRTIEPAVAAADLPAADVVLLSHDHPDHLDQAGRAVLGAAPVVLTTPAAASRLGPHAIGLAPWDSYELDSGDTRVRITAAPARHGPAAVQQTGAMAFTMNGHAGARLAATLNPRTVIPVHYDAFEHLAEPPEAISEAFRQAGMSDRLRWLPPGVPQQLDWPDSRP
jgi:L-ascorbate metabolism protein UlaG (beta-lactamase superfamily)